MRYWIVVALLGVATPVAAQGLDAQRYVPAAGAAGGFLVERAVVPTHLGWALGLFFNYADDPLVQTDRNTRATLARPIDNALAMDLMGSIAFFHRLELALHLPVALWYAGDSIAPRGTLLQASSGFGDLRLVPKVVFLRHHFSAFDLGLGAALPVTFPTGSSRAMRGANVVTFEPRLLGGLFGRRWSASLSVGVRLRTGLDDTDLVGHEISAGVAGSVSLLARDLIDLMVELGVSGNLSRHMPEATGAPLELILGAVFKPHRRWNLYTGVGIGLTNGLGTPDFRLILGLRYTHRPADAYKDSDGDGIADINDKCPDDPEDFDGFEDEDGCPDLDNDKDGVPDDRDECPDVPEEPGGDGDGCPDKGRVIVKHGKIVLVGKVLFATGSATISPKSQHIMSEMASALKRHTEIKRIEIQGHTDNIGGQDFNQKLSEQRAISVRKALLRRGIAPDRLTTRGYGESKPVSSNMTPAGRARNRRVEFVAK